VLGRPDKFIWPLLIKLCRQVHKFPQLALTLFIHQILTIS
jgi:hypothetical protein